MKETRDAQREIRKIQWGEKRERSTEEAVSVSQAKEKAELFFSPSSWMEAEGGAMSQIDFAGLAVYVAAAAYLFVIARSSLSISLEWERIFGLEYHDGLTREQSPLLLRRRHQLNREESMRDDQAKRSPIVTYQHPLLTARRRHPAVMQGVVFLFFGWLVGWVDLCRSTLEFMSRQQQEGCIKHLFAAGKGSIILLITHLATFGAPFWSYRLYSVHNTLGNPAAIKRQILIPHTDSKSSIR
ncbi:hypothetical protein TRV_01277 [Trichophyton verrucosum HKI 0517]|uniref:Uncharacterized protein n=1 Tax=Trichophyton verrucosum (strain HKI 0517) TaxID=663202 RepID=D4D2H2_TRIVH|nr:uncharacterized protein TRV_01277 [Trichophyton verrucosum HKI 0517]EFE43954.1 hypothetical protein TRV_01277 [Trichophyton verrucosum HKI 0517]